MTPSISNILDRLTEPMREAVFNASPLRQDLEGSHVHWSVPSSTLTALRRRGIVVGGRRSRRLTPLGLEVQSALRASEGNRS